MRRIVMLTLTLALVLLIAVPAFAKKDKPPVPPAGEPIPGTTCVSPWWEGDIHDTDEDGWSNDFEIVLTADEPDACIDVLTKVSGIWNITVEGEGARAMTIVPRDAYAPGDSCGGEQRRGDAVYESWTLPHPDDARFDVIPASTVNACPDDDESGIGYFAETIERPSGDVEIVSIPTDEVHPLALLVFSQGLRRNGTVTVSVDLPGVD